VGEHRAEVVNTRATAAGRDRRAFHPLKFIDDDGRKNRHVSHIRRPHGVVYR
jgi:hypothetical protein